MATIQEEIKTKLVDNGMFEDQADAVISAMKADESNEAMSNRWQDNPSGYPPQFLAALWFSAKGYAREYIIKNCPNAWFRPCFE